MHTRSFLELVLGGLCAAGVLMMLAGPAVAEPMPAAAAAGGPHAFDQIKALSGNWQAKTADGKVAHVSYELDAGGTAVVERLHPDGEPSMMTVYYPDGDRLMLTHYCLLGNHPRMRSEQAAAAGNQVAFAYVDGTNMKGAGDAHMHRVKLTFADKDHFSQEWTLMKDGKETAMTFNFERSK